MKLLLKWLLILVFLILVVMPMRWRTRLTAAAPGSSFLAGLLTAGSLAAGSFAFGPLAAGASATPSSPAQATSVSSAKSHVAVLENQLQSQGQEISALDERYNQAMLALQRTQVALSAAQQRVAAAQALMVQAREILKHQVIDAYVMDTPASGLTALVKSSMSDVATRHQYLDAAARRQMSVIASYRQSVDQLQAAQVRLQDQEGQAATEAGSARSAQQAAQSVNAAEISALNQAKGHLADLVAAQASLQAQQAATQASSGRQGAEARAAAAASVANDVAPFGGTSASQSATRATSFARGATSDGAVSSNAATSNTGAAPPLAGGAAAVDAAEAQLGKPYVWGGEGPGGFDCSGLTMVAWRAAGVYLDHSAAAQYEETTHVRLSNLQPGDLLFYNWGSGIDHVTMYIGGGQVIEAPHTGSIIRIVSIWYSGLVGAGRP